VAADSGAIVAFAGFENGGEASGLLRIGSFVDIELSGRKIENVARLPESALYNQGRVYLVRDNRLVGRKVRPLRWENGEVLISAGLDEGDLVLVNHLPNIKPDIRVKVVQE
jgi:multidrug efflux pump subunit AcrA (membrane-fusion protein)